MSWYLQDAALFVSGLNKACTTHHFALAGGVLNNGFSLKDLDIAVLRRCEHPVYEDVLGFLKDRGLSVYEIKGTDVWTVVKTKNGEGKRIDFLFPCRVEFDKKP